MKLLLGIIMAAVFGVAVGFAVCLLLNNYTVNQGTATQQIAGQTYYLSGSGISASATSITLTSLTLPQNGYKIQDSDLSDTFYITLEPGNRTKQEIVSCTTLLQNAAGTATLSGCTRGLAPVTPYTASTTLQFAHGGSTQVIFSNPPQVFNQYVTLTNTETLSGIKTFTASTTFSQGALAGYNCDTNTTALAYCPKVYMDAIAVAGASNANDTTKGIIETATGAEAALGTSLGGTGARLALGANLGTSTCQIVANSVLIGSSTTGKLDKNCFDQNGIYTIGSTTITTFQSANATTTSSLYILGRLNFLTTSASSSALLIDAFGNVTANAPQMSILSVDTSNQNTTNSASTTIKTVAIAANTLSVTQALRVSSQWVNKEGVNTCFAAINFGTGSATTSLGALTVTSGTIGSAHGDIYATSTSAESAVFVSAVYLQNLAASYTSFIKNINYSTTATLYIGFEVKNNGSGACYLVGETVERLSQ